jgi:hypothetical protein
VIGPRRSRDRKSIVIGRTSSFRCIVVGPAKPCDRKRGYTVVIEVTWFGEFLWLTSSQPNRCSRRSEECIEVIAEAKCS